jgi:hypothetical protein
MDPISLQMLLQPLGQEALVAAEELEPTPESVLTCLSTLQKRYPRELARAALETVLLRRQARQKFPTWWKRLYATREALEQASGERIALYRAGRYSAYPRVADLTCGLGADCLALAMTGHSVHAVDRDPLRVALTKANAAAWHLNAQITTELSDGLSFSSLEVESCALWVDPDRRRNQQRYLHPEDYQPPLSVLVSRWGTSRPWGVKLAPGLPLAAIQSYRCQAEIEFIADGSELKECVLWFGPLRSCQRRATILLPDRQSANETSPARADVESGLRLRSSVVSLGTSESIPPPLYAPLASYVYHPSPAVVRAGLLDFLAVQLNAARLHPRTTLLTADRPMITPFAETYQVLERLPADTRHFRRALIRYSFASVTVMQCGSPLDAPHWNRLCQQALRNSSPPPSSENAFLLLTQDGQRPCLVLAMRLLGSPLQALDNPFRVC